MSEKEEIDELKKQIEKLSASLGAIHYSSGRFLTPLWQEIALKDTISALRAIHSECEHALPKLKEIDIKTS